MLRSSLRIQANACNLTAARGLRDATGARASGGQVGHPRGLGVTALSVEARYLEPELPDELDDAYAQTFDRLRRMFRARGCSQEEAADLAQEAAIRAWMHIRRWGVADSGLDPLLNRISRNLLIDRYRRATPHLVPLDSAEEIQDHTQDPSEEVARRQRRSAVRSAISSLPTRHQAAITYSLSGLSPEEVGKQMGIGRNAADALLHRARRSLREHLAPVRDGMWTLAFGARMRIDRLFRRTGLEERFGEASVIGVASTAMNVATAAIVAVLTVTGGGVGSPAYARAGAGSARSAVHAPASIGAHSGSSNLTGGTLPPGSSGVHAYHFGFAHGTYDSNGTDNQVTVPGPDPKQPLINVHYKLFRQEENVPGPPVTQKICSTVISCD